MRIARNYLLVRAIMLLLIPVAPARAHWEPGQRACEKKHYPTALKELKPFAESRGFIPGLNRMSRKALRSAPSTISSRQNKGFLEAFLFICSD
jgi:hypothetical protein